MFVGDQDAFYLNVPDGAEQLFRFSGSVDDDTLVGFGTDDDIAIVVVGTHVYLGDFQFAIVMKGHDSPRLDNSGATRLR